ncbi:hypothetical protein RRU94_00225 [Domibacillus sp. DTU_2020_1001157_1_SI_ALB_TIR_016]|uniref:hypothetical protein n=1 Tax=Domibacillus sp. DTU_2020_1001157_1_SI_ALB_TIR_016 TaxID=3077789 RepID=UPI0028E440E7|nr:hypothetical protein [Domibacillus sp. DTU_2020_1001157_1_SI_ALB_TIR_016]WNS78438.1 hypothetical protein RRU94_00225 [Domibacillus sp. DTU_2020_1001157_1_SI_ALB_TIR_016]
MDGTIAMSTNSDWFMFIQEMTRLTSDYKRCEDKRIKEQIVSDITLLKEAIALLSYPKR